MNNVETQAQKKLDGKCEPILPRGILGKRTARTVIFSEGDMMMDDDRWWLEAATWHKEKGCCRFR